MTDRLHQRINILLIEDNPSRLKLVRNALEVARTRCRLHTVGAGSDSLNYLRQRHPYLEAPKPDLVLFDFSHPGTRYLELVEEIKMSREFESIPFALLTRPETEQLLENKFEPTGDCVIFSPIELADFLHTMNSLRIDRFMNAVALIADIGFVLIRVPETFVEDTSSLPLARSA